ncbi:MAG: glycerol-3-phosphate 1-O-acyltransferase PlsY [Spirulinaceae cyanobacterium]
MVSSLSLLISLIFVIFAYLLGSLPNGYLLGRYLQGIDIREYGSGSTGATNVFRTLGKTAGIIVLMADLLKGVIAVGAVKGFFAFVAQSFLPLSWEPWFVTLAAIAAVIGHSKSIWLNFTGGKSVATSLGVLLVMSPFVALGTIVVFALVFAIWRIVSLGSICGAIAVNLLMLALNQPLPYIIFATIAGIYIIWRHQSNIQRLFAGTEPKLGENLSQ